MKKYIIALLALTAVGSSNAGFAQTAKTVVPDGCRIVCGPTHKHHVAKKTPKMTQESMVLNENSPTTVVEIKKGIVYVNDKPVAVIKNPRYEDHSIIINTEQPEAVLNVITDNSYTGNKPDMPLLGLFTTNDCNGGAMIHDILPNGPAERAGLYPGDVITKLGDNDINNSEQLVLAIYKNSPGDNVTVTYKRDGKTVTTEAQLTDASKVANCSNPGMTEEYGYRRRYEPMYER
jgi:membrane-associated protease RseP (regulator of RpoE activity)